ncbi:BLOC-3 complex member HPS1-like isoform X2 [Corticium candelabrum]|uniref:BLOC-3 complex member HPS1-like isoform X2 n=1 Tax=Corticium candelabrum TaxID=121492 RepID=UPI002E270A61|nr:BLOC-3 complex member HPS1-like isoform X2 [Corticium candelabrum]
MKCFVVFNATSELVFFSADDEFKRVIIEKQRQQDEEVKEAYACSDSPDMRSTGLSSQTNEQEVNMNTVATLFLPLFASQLRFTNVGNSLSSVSCEDGSTYVFYQFSDLTCVAVSKDPDEDEDYLLRKAHVFQNLVQLLYGPVTSQLNPSAVREKYKRWKLLANCLDTWEQLWKRDQAFLVEALEMLLVKKDLNAHCIQLLEQSLRTMKGVEEAAPSHAFLLAGTKLLALYSSMSATELHSADIMLITVLARNLFPPQPPAAATPPPGEERRETPSFATPVQEADFYTPQSEAIVHNQKMSELERDVERFGAIAEEIVEADDVLLPLNFGEDERANDSPRADDQEVEGILTKGSAIPGFRSPYNEEQAAELSSVVSEPVSIGRRSAAYSYYSQSQPEERQLYYRYNVFLHTPVCPSTPYLLHCLEVMPGTVLVIISEVPHGQVAALICNVLSRLSSLRTVDSNLSREIVKTGAKAMVEYIDNNIKRIIDSVRRIADTTRKKKLKKSASDLQRDLVVKWEVIKDKGLQELLEKIVDEGQVTSQEELYSLEDKVRDMSVILLQFFRDLFLNTKSPSSDRLKDCMTTIQRILRALKDHEEFLTIKAMRNVPASQYLKDYPGLIHFIYVNRTNDQVTVPSLNVENLEGENGDERSIQESGLPVSFLKEKVWKMCKLFRSHLVEGCTAAAIREGDFLYSYHLWFEDSVGNTLQWDQAARVPQESILPGILAGPFYKELHRIVCSSHRHSPNTVHCYELMCIHVGVVSMQYAATQAKRLANAIWETSAVSSPMNLL